MSDKARRLQVPDVTVAVQHLERDRIASRAGKRRYQSASTASHRHCANQASHTESIAFWVFLALDVLGEGFLLDRWLAGDRRTLARGNDMRRL